VTTFCKPPLPVTKQLQVWVDRGLQVDDPASAKHYLQTIGYYRLSAYTLSFQSGGSDHSFKPGTSFEDVRLLYNFDRALRLLVLDAIERVEVAVRATINNHMSLRHGAHWYMEEARFRAGYDHKALLADIERQCRRSKETFLRHYKDAYTSPRLPPSWMVTELLTYGQLSRVYDNLAEFGDQKAIARVFEINAEVLRSWVQSIAYVRNLCAHHSRLWNRELGIAPKVPRHPQNGWIRRDVQLADPAVDPNKRLYLILASLAYLLRAVNPESSWCGRLKGLLAEYPEVSRAHMGMPDDWESDSFWGSPVAK